MRQTLIRSFFLGLGFCIIGGLLPTAASAQSLPGRRYSNFEESSTSYTGVAASWNGYSWNNIPCPASVGFVNKVNEFINGLGAITPSNQGYAATWVQIGHQKRRYYAGQPAQCTLDNRFYWERQFVGSDGYINYNIGTITGAGTSTHNHRYALTKMFSGCGHSWCWDFRIDDVSYHTAGGEQSELAQVRPVQMTLECVWDNSGYGGCPADGAIWDVGKPATAKNASTGTWSSWSGRDSACVDGFAGMRGDWDTADEVKYGINVSMSAYPSNCP